MSKTTSQLATFEEADSALRALGNAQREIARLELECQGRIDAAKARLAEARIGGDAVVKSTTKLLTRFIEKHQAEIEERGGKTVRLTFGRIGMRTPPPALKLEKGFTEADVIAWIRRHLKNPDDYIQVKESIRRDELRLLEDDQLAQIGMRIDQDEVVVIEPAQDLPATEVA